MGRKKAREQSFFLIFEKGFQEDMQVEDLVLLHQECGEAKWDEYALRTAQKTWENISKLDEMIASSALKWANSRISRVSLALLRLAVYEMTFGENIPASVAINEAVELAKRYGSEEEGAFVNGVLGAVVRKADMAKHV